MRIIRPGTNNSIYNLFILYPSNLHVLESAYGNMGA